jgi:TPP-dependent pyruvate/acetoin dehydrogenase alpha subunit
VVFVCENNQYAMSARSDWSIAGGDPARRAAGYGIPGVNVDGMDLFAVHAAAADLVERARRGEGPAYLVCTTYRFHGHHAGDPLNYREREEVERWREQDPIERVKRVAIERGAITQQEVEELQQRIQKQIDDAVEFAKNSPDPTPDQLMTDIYA